MRKRQIIWAFVIEGTLWWRKEIYEHTESFNFIVLEMPIIVEIWNPNFITFLFGRNWDRIFVAIFLKSTMFCSDFVSFQTQSCWSLYIFYNSYIRHRSSYIPYLVIFISPVTNIGHTLVILLRNKGKKFGFFILIKLKIGKIKSLLQI